jgi:hypothetical protein
LSSTGHVHLKLINLGYYPFLLQCVQNFSWLKSYWKGLLTSKNSEILTSMSVKCPR